MEGEVVDDDGPDSRLREHSQPRCSWGSALLLRFSRSQWDGGQPATSGQPETVHLLYNALSKCITTLTIPCSPSGFTHDEGDVCGVADK